VDGLSSLRSRACFGAIVSAFKLARRKQAIRLVEFSVQGNHLHLIVEAADAVRLARAMQGLGISIAKRLNALLGRSGPVFADRYHVHILKTPTEVANAVAYVRGNFAVHARRQGAEPIAPIDPCSSAGRSWTGGYPRIRDRRSWQRPGPGC
jgi:REP element-mobilizing transposase RayT